jgi:outer membrane cobalamin receptor
MNKRLSLAAGLCSLLFVSTPILAQVGGAGGDSSDDPSDQDVWSESLIVTASRSEQEARDLGVNVTILDRAAVERSAALTVDDFLRQVPGFSLFRRSSSLAAHPTSQGVSLRGIGPSGVSRTLVLLDGLPLNDPFGGWVYWSSVSLESIERVEIVRGGASNVWGNSALGGAIQILTREPIDGLFNLSAEVGNKDTIRLDASYGNRWQKGSVRLFGNFFDTDGYWVLEEGQRGAIDISAFSEHHSFGLSAAFDLSPSATLRLGGRSLNEDRGNGTPLTNNGTETVTVSVRLNAVTESGGEWRASLVGHDQTFDSTFSSQAADRSSENPALDQFDVPAEALAASVQWLRSFGGDRRTHLLTAGGEFRLTKGQTNESFRYVNGSFVNSRQAGGDQELGGLFIQDAYSVGDRWRFQIGARVDRWKSLNGRRLETFIDSGFVRRAERPENRSETRVSPKLSAVYQVSGRARLRGSLYRSFRAPTINELFRPFRVRNDITEANAALEPEVLDGAELGVDLQGRRLRSALTLFHNVVDDPVANVTLALRPGVIAPCGFVPPGGSCKQRQNLDRSRIQGVEADLRYRPNRHWEISGSYLFTNAETRAAEGRPVLEGKRIAQVPENQLVAAVAYSNPAAIDVSLQGRFIDEQWEDDRNTRLLESFVVFDLALSREISDEWRLFLRFENLFAEHVEVGRSSNGFVAIGAPLLVHGGFRVRLQQSLGTDRSSATSSDRMGQKRHRLGG